MSDDAYMVRVTRTATRGGFFLTPRAGLTRLRVHAAQFTSEAAATSAAAEITQNHPGEYTAKAVPAARPERGERHAARHR